MRHLKSSLAKWRYKNYFCINAENSKLILYFYKPLIPVKDSIQSIDDGSTLNSFHQLDDFIINYFGNEPLRA